MKIHFGPAAFFWMASCFATNSASGQSVNLLGRSCGPESVSFDASAGASARPSASVDPTRATVYVIGSYVGGAVADPTVRVGLDGAWTGALRGSSYLYFSVQPGEHHLCASWQPGLLTPSGLVSLVNFTAEAGRTYYFRARTFVEAGRGQHTIDLGATNDDEGQYLVASSPFSKSHPKK